MPKNSDAFQCPECYGVWGVEELLGTSFPFQCPGCGADITDDDMVEDEEE